MKQKVWLGIDPGAKGFLMGLNEKSELVVKEPIPLIGDDIDLHELNKILKKADEDFNLTVIIEEVHALPLSSAASTFSFGLCVGAIRMAVIANHIRYVRVTPKVWQLEVWLTAEIEKKPDKEGLDKKGNTKIIKGQTDTKLTSLKAAKRLFPIFDFRATARSKKDHDGAIDAALIAEYGRRKNV